MKIVVIGKGGVGKTTIVATLARLYADEGRRVYAADVDSDANLGLALGLSEEELNNVIPISKMKKMIEERTGVDKSNTFYKANPKVDDIPDKFRKYPLIACWLIFMICATARTIGYFFIRTNRSWQKTLSISYSEFALYLLFFLFQK